MIYRILLCFVCVFSACGRKSSKGSTDERIHMQERVKGIAFRARMATGGRSVIYFYNIDEKKMTKVSRDESEDLLLHQQGRKLFVFNRSQTQQNMSFFDFDQDFARSEEQNTTHLGPHEPWGALPWDEHRILLLKNSERQISLFDIRDRSDKPLYLTMTARPSFAVRDGDSVYVGHQGLDEHYKGNKASSVGVVNARTETLDGSKPISVTNVNAGVMRDGALIVAGICTEYMATECSSGVEKVEPREKKSARLRDISGFWNNGSVVPYKNGFLASVIRAGDRNAKSIRFFADAANEDKDFYTFDEKSSGYGLLMADGDTVVIGDSRIEDNHVVGVLKFFEGGEFIKEWVLAEVPQEGIWVR